MGKSTGKSSKGRGRKLDGVRFIEGTDIDKVRNAAERLGPNVKKAKVRITCMLDRDVLDALRMQADENNTRYQTLMNQILRRHLFAGEDHYITREDFTRLLDELEKIMATG